MAFRRVKDWPFGCWSDGEWVVYVLHAEGQVRVMLEDSEKEIAVFDLPPEIAKDVALRMIREAEVAEVSWKATPVCPNCGCELDQRKAVKEALSSPPAKEYPVEETCPRCELSFTVIVHRTEEGWFFSSIHR